MRAAGTFRETKGCAHLRGGVTGHRLGRAGPLVITIMGAVSQWEREAIGERTRDALRHKRAQGQRVGNIEFGFRLSADGLHLEPDSAEQAALSAIRQLRTGDHSLRRIAATLNGCGHRTRQGTQWRLESVARVTSRCHPRRPPERRPGLASTSFRSSQQTGVRTR